MINNNLVAIRNKIGMSREELAEKTGLATETIARYERGEREPKANVVNKLARALGVSISCLMGETDGPEANSRGRYSGVPSAPAAPDLSNAMIFKYSKGSEQAELVIPICTPKEAIQTAIAEAVRAVSGDVSEVCKQAEKQ